MNVMTLDNPTGAAAVDAALCRTLAAYADAFPGRVCACYVLGSYADRSGVATSDVDLVLVFAARWHDGAEAAAAARLATTCAAAEAAHSALELDIELVDEATLSAGLSPTLARGARLVSGAEVRAGMPLIPLAAWTRERMHSSYGRLVMLFGRPLPVVPPLAYPAAADEFYGYLRRTVRLPSGADVPCTRDLIRAVGWAATALLALHAGIMVARKSECHVLYRAHIGGAWCDLLDELYLVCRGEWQYLIPSNPADRQRLRAICGRTLAFENHFLDDYRGYALAELGADDAAGRAEARRVLTRLPLDDAAVLAALRV